MNIKKCILTLFVACRFQMLAEGCMVGHTPPQQLYFVPENQGKVTCKISLCDNFLGLCVFLSQHTTCSLHAYIHLQWQTDPYRENYDVGPCSKEYSLTIQLLYTLSSPLKLVVNMCTFSYCACPTSYSGWAYNRVKIPSCKNFEAKEEMGVYSRQSYFREGIRYMYLILLFCLHSNIAWWFCMVVLFCLLLTHQ